MPDEDPNHDENDGPDGDADCDNHAGMRIGFALIRSLSMEEKKRINNISSICVAPSIHQRVREKRTQNKTYGLANTFA